MKGSRSPYGVAYLGDHVLAPPKYIDREFPTRTEAGKRWVIKALHPADHVIKAERLPASSRYPTVVQEIISTFDIAAPSGISSTDTWAFRVVTHTDPLVPVTIYRNKTGDDETLAGSYLNQCYFKLGDAFKIHTAGELEAALANFEAACETYRINALSTTGVFVGASLTDQGSIVSSQFVDSQKTTTFWDVPSPDQMGFQSLGKLWIDPLPTMSEATLGSHPYITSAREGWYAPQKLSNPGHWTRTNDRVFRGRYMDTNNPQFIRFSDVERWPAMQSSEVGATYWISTCDDGCSQTFVRGLAPTTTFRITVRMCLEMGVVPSNDLSSFAVQPPAPDPIAIEMYDAVVAEMMDAYPSVDNDLGKFWGKIKDVASKVVKVVDPVLGVASAAGLPYAKTLRSIVSGMSSDSQKYIDDEEGGLKSALEKLSADRKQRKEEAAKKAAAAKLKKVATDAAAKSKLLIVRKDGTVVNPKGGKV